jgi:hypothetical protein
VLNFFRSAGHADDDDTLVVQGLYEHADAAGCGGDQRDIPGLGVCAVEKPGAQSSPW